MILHFILEAPVHKQNSLKSLLKLKMLSLHQMCLFCQIENTLNKTFFAISSCLCLTNIQKEHLPWGLESQNILSLAYPKWFCKVSNLLLQSTVCGDLALNLLIGGVLPAPPSLWIRTAEQLHQQKIWEILCGLFQDDPVFCCFAYLSIEKSQTSSCLANGIEAQTYFSSWNSDVYTGAYWDIVGSLTNPNLCPASRAAKLQMNHRTLADEVTRKK